LTAAARICRPRCRTPHSRQAIALSASDRPAVATVIRSSATPNWSSTTWWMEWSHPSQPCVILVLLSPRILPSINLRPPCCVTLAPP